MTTAQFGILKFGSGEFGTGLQITPPAVTTGVVSNLTTNSATVTGNVTGGGSSPVTERGIVWGIAPNPTTSNNKNATPGTTGSFSVNLHGLTPGTAYYARAFVTNSGGTVYGNNVTFTTLFGAISIRASELGGLQYIQF